MAKDITQIEKLTYTERDTQMEGSKKRIERKVNFQKDRRRDGRLDIVEFKKRQTQIKCCKNRKTDRKKVLQEQRDRQRESVLKCCL